MRLLFATEAVIATLVVVAFVLPLWGAHLRLLEERVRRRSEVYLALDRVVQTMRTEVHADNFVVMDGLTKALTGLTEERGSRFVPGIVPLRLEDQGFGSDQERRSPWARGSYIDTSGCMASRVVSSMRARFVQCLCGVGIPRRLNRKPQ